MDHLTTVKKSLSKGFWTFPEKVFPEIISGKLRSIFGKTGFYIFFVGRLFSTQKPFLGLISMAATVEKIFLISTITFTREFRKRSQNLLRWQSKPRKFTPSTRTLEPRKSGRSRYISDAAILLNDQMCGFINFPKMSRLYFREDFPRNASRKRESISGKLRFRRYKVFHEHSVNRIRKSIIEFIYHVLRSRIQVH